MVNDLRHILMEPLVDHQFLEGEPSDLTHVTRSVFGDGTEILCDFKAKRLEVDGKDYPLPVALEKEPEPRQSQQV